jgi:DNA-directed RNA polymerase specialized sigma24 family protein
MPDRAALIEAQIPGLRRFACALMRGDRERADDLVQDTLERARFLAGTCGRRRAICAVGSIRSSTIAF